MAWATNPTPVEPCEAELTDGVYRRYLDNTPRENTAIKEFDLADRDPEFRLHLNKAIEADPRTQAASSEGLEFRDRIKEALVRSYGKGSEEHQLVQAPYQTLFRMFQQLLHGRDFQDKPLALLTAQMLARGDTLEHKHRDVETMDDEFKASREGRSVYDFYTSRLKNYLNHEERKETTETKDADFEKVKAWGEQIASRIKAMRARNLGDLVLEAVEASGASKVTFTSSDEFYANEAFGTPNSKEHKFTTLPISNLDGWIGAEAVENTIAFSDMIYLAAPTTKAPQAPIGNQPKYQYGVPNGHLLGKISRGYLALKMHIGRAELELKLRAALKLDANSPIYVSVNSIERYIKVLAESGVAQSVIQSLYYRIHLEHRLYRVQDHLSYLCSKDPWFGIPRVMKILAGKANLERRFDRTQHTMPAGLTARIEQGGLQQPADSVTGVEWFGYSRGFDHWVMRDMGVPNLEGSNPPPVEKPKGPPKKKSQWEKLREKLRDKIKLKRKHTISALVVAAGVGILGTHLYADKAAEEQPDSIGASNFSRPANTPLKEKGTPPLDVVVLQSGGPTPRYFDFASVSDLKDAANSDPVESSDPFSSTSLMYSTLKPVRIDSEGRAVVPSPEGFFPTYVSAPMSHRGETTSIVPQVRRHRESGLYFAQFPKYYAGKKAMLSVYLRQDSTEQEPNPLDSRVFNLNKSKLLEISNLLFKAKLITLGDSLWSLTLRSGPVGLAEVASAFNNSQIYSHRDERMIGWLTVSPLNPFWEWTRFLDDDGKLYYECNGGNSLLKKVLSLYFEGQGDVQVRNVASLVVANYETGHARAKVAGHLRTLVSLDGGRSQIYLDGTPFEQEGPESFEVIVPPENVPPLPEPQLPFIDPGYVPDNRFRTMRQRETVSKEDLEKIEEFHASKEQQLEVARKALIADKDFRRIAKLDRSKSHVALRLYKISGYFQRFAQSEIDLAELENGVSSVFPGMAPRFNSPSDINDFYQILANWHERMWIAIEKKSTGKPSDAWYFSSTLKNKSYGLLYTLKSYSWRSPDDYF